MKLSEKVSADFNRKLVLSLVENLNISIEAYQRMKNDNKKYFELPNNKWVLGYMRSFAVERQIYLGAFQPNAIYTAQFRRISKSGQAALFIETEHFILNIGKTRKRGKLLQKANYKKELAKNNAVDNPQIQLEFSDLSTLRLKDRKNYGMLVYGYDNVAGITHFDLLVPDEKYKGIILPIFNLKSPQLSIVPDFSQINEPQIISLRKELEKKFTLEEKG